MKRNTPTLPFNLDLLFENNSMLGPSAHVVIRFCSKDDDGTTYIGPDCKTPEEWHYLIDRLQAELEILRNRGIREFIASMNNSKRKRKKK